MHLVDCTPYALLTMWGILCLAHIAASSSSLQDNIISDASSLVCESTTVTSRKGGSENVTTPVGHARGEAGRRRMNTQDVLGSELFDLALDRFQIRPQLVALKNILHHHRFKACSTQSGVSKRQRSPRVLLCVCVYEQKAYVYPS